MLTQLEQTDLGEIPTYLKEPAQPPNLEYTLAQNDPDDKQIPPLDAAVGALGGVTVGSLAHNNVALLVLDHLHHVREFAHLGLERILGRIGLRNVDDTVDVERHFLGGGAPVLVAEAVHVLAVVFGLEGEIAVGYRLFKCLVLADRILDL